MEQYTDIYNIESRKIYSDGAYAFNGRTLYLCLLLLEALITLGAYLASSGLDWESATKLGIILNLFICFFHFGYHLLNRPVNYLSPDLIYLITYFMFHMGYTVLWLFGIVPPIPFIFVNTSLWPKTMCLVNLGLIGFLFGYVFAARSRQKLPDIQPIKLPTPMWTLVGVFFMLLSLGIHFAYIIVVGPATFLTRGYEVYSRMHFFTSHTILWQLMPQIFLLGFTIYIVSVALKHGKIFKGKLGIILFAIQTFLLATEGARTALVIISSVLLLVYHYLIKPVKLRWLILAGIASMFLFAFIGIVRGTAAFDIAKLWLEYKYARGTGQTHWYDFLAEAGQSVNTINMTTIIVPSDISYWHGRSYLTAMLHIAPFLQGVLANINPILTQTAGDILVIGGLWPHGAAGLGYTMVAEGYLNFGIPGAFLHMMILGIWLRRLYVRFASLATPSRALIFFASIGIFLINVRNNTNILFTPLAQIFVMAWLLRHLCGETEVYSPDHQVGWSYEEEVYADQFGEKAGYTIES